MKKIRLFYSIILFLFASCNGQKTPCQDLVSKINGHDINKFVFDTDDQNSYTLLGYTIKCGDLEEVKKMTNGEADVKLAKSDGIYEYDALFVAIEEGNYNIVKFLLSRKDIDPNRIYNEEGLSPLSLSVINQNFDITKLLLDHKANVNGVGNHGGEYTVIPLKEALKNKNEKIVKLLLSHKASTTNLTNDDLQLLKRFSFSHNSEKKSTKLNGKFVLVTKGEPIGDDDPSEINFYLSFENNKAFLSIGSDNLDEIYCEGEYDISLNNDIYVLKYVGEGTCSSDEEINTLKIKISGENYYIKGNRFLDKNWMMLKEKV